MNRTRPGQSGSALVFVLIGIVLFAALSWAIMQSSRGNINALTKERARAAATEIVAYGDALAKGVQMLRLRGCSDKELNFANTIWKNGNGTDVHSASHNPAASPECGVFASGEGNILPVLFDTNNFETGSFGTQQGSSRIRIMSFAGVGDATNQDIFYNLPLLKKEICLAINSLLEIEDDAGSPPSITEATVADYAGDNYAVAPPYTDTGSRLYGKTAFCAYVNSASYKFFRVLVSR